MTADRKSLIEKIDNTISLAYKLRADAKKTVEKIDNATNKAEHEDLVACCRWLRNSKNRASGILSREVAVNTRLH